MPRRAARGSGNPTGNAPSAPGEEARAVALRLLARRERSAAELRERLRARGFDEPVVEEVLEALQRTGLQDDRRFAELMADEAVRSRGLASRAVFGALRVRGVDKELAAAASAEPPESEEERAFALARRRARQLGALPREQAYRRLLSYLARRGYDAEVCHRAVDTALREAAEAGSPDD